MYNESSKHYQGFKMTKEFIKFSPTKWLSDNSNTIENVIKYPYKSLAQINAIVMSELLNCNVSVYGAGVNSMDTGNYVLGYYNQIDL